MTLDQCHDTLSGQKQSLCEFSTSNDFYIKRYKTATNMPFHVDDLELAQMTFG